jgi:hypothetical protein
MNRTIHREARPMRSVVTALVILLGISTPAAARDVGGVQVPDSLRVAGAEPLLVLNGAGYRKKLFVEVYVGALYLTAPVTQANRVLEASGTRVMRLAFVREVGAGKLITAWNDGFTANHSGAELQALRARLDRFNGLMRDVRRGDVLQLDLLPNGETRVRLNDELRGSMDGADFQRALLKVWLGAEPADASLKQALLGGG